ncbi:MAG: YbaK/EbsC family protein [Erysipelotrichaceae bacterium]|jgi:prolyl-tRNA editing enzyme YbaK/EbsC (Cys-tRNA(Pro) deacylase)|nr:YbaK/EbsC family protein [Erysipelotrichaceae bacterium]
MSLHIVQEYLKPYAKDSQIIELSQSSATVELAAQALGIQEGRIAKTLSLWVKDHAVVIVCAGDCRIDNRAFKEVFKTKPKMLKAEEVERYTNHTIGGVCPFSIPKTTDIYFDKSLKRFESVYPACGSANSAIELTIDELENIVPFLSWIDVCKGWKE